MKNYVIGFIIATIGSVSVLFGGHTTTLKVGNIAGDGCYVYKTHYNWNGDITSEEEWYQESWN